MGAAMIELLGDDLAILSLRVAQQVDRKLSGKSYDRKVFQDFGKELSKATGISDPNAYSLFRSDPSVTEVFAQAVTEVSNHPISDITELTNALGDIIGPLSSADEALPDHDFAQMKVFCLSLHKTMMSQRLPPLSEENAFEDRLGFIR